MNCLKCGNPLREGAKFCMSCGHKVPRCPTCGTPLLKRAKFCMADGTRIPEDVLELIPPEVQPAVPTAVEEKSPAAQEVTEAVPAAKEVTEAVPAAQEVTEAVPAAQEVTEAVPAAQEVTEAVPAVEENPPFAANSPNLEPPAGSVQDPLPAREPPKPRYQPPEPQDPSALTVHMPETSPEKKKPRFLIPLIAAVAALLLLTAGLFAGKALFGSGDGPAVLPGTAGDPGSVTDPAETGAASAGSVPQETQAPPVLMPDCVGLLYDDVVRLFEQLPGRVNFAYAYSDTVEENRILEQNLAKDSNLTEESDILFTVSKGPDVAPEGYNQKVTVTAAPGSSYGTLTLYDWENGQWVAKFSCNATVGIYGISPDYGEGRKRTPQGTFKLGVALTAQNLTDVDWPVHMATKDTCVIDDVDSPDYNTIHQVQDVPYGVSYDPIGYLLSQGSSTICIYIEHNGNGYDTENVVPGNGSVITLCGRKPAIEPTPGCVDISASNMEILISLLSYGKNTHIEIYTE